MNKIGIIPGRFAGMHLGHISLIEKSQQENDETYIVIITGKKSSENKDLNPLSFKLKKEIFQYNFPNVKIIEWNNAYIPDIIKHYNIEGEIVIYAGGDRIKGYEGQFKDFKHVTIKEIPRKTIDVSGTEIREWIRSGDIDKAKEFLPDMKPVNFNQLIKAISSTGIKEKIKEIWNRINDKYNKSR